MTLVKKPYTIEDIFNSVEFITFSDIYNVLILTNEMIYSKEVHTPGKNIDIELNSLQKDFFKILTEYFFDNEYEDIETYVQKVFLTVDDRIFDKKLHHFKERRIPWFSNFENDLPFQKNKDLHWI